MAQINFIPTDKEQKTAEKKGEEIITSMDGLSLEMKAWILHILIRSFYDAYGIDVCKTFQIELED